MSLRAIIEPFRFSAAWDEAKVVARVLTASTIGTLLDGLAYQLIVLSAAGRYALAALVGAGIGALTHFYLGRTWAFRNQKRRFVPQLGLYVLGSLFTYFALHASLRILVEASGIDPRFAWPPAKAIAFLVVGYPFQRLVVFRGSST